MRVNRMMRHAVDAVALVVPSAIFLEINMMGRLFVSELILLGLLPFLLMVRARLLLVALPRKFLLFGLVWLFSQILTDIIRATPFEDFARGWSKIAFMLTNFSALYLILYRRQRRLVLFAAGIALGQILDFCLTSSDFALYYPWKFGVGWAVTIFLILCSQLRFVNQIPFLSVSIIGLAGILNIYLDFRSLAAICFFTGIYIFTKRFHKPNKLMPMTIKAKNIILLTLLMLTVGSALLKAYGYAAMQGWLGDEARQKYEWQASGKFGVLLGGRAELFVSLKAIINSPIIGHGSWAKDPQYSDLLYEQLEKYGYAVQRGINSDKIPSHSYIFGAWVESGFIGAIFWFWVLLFTVRTLANLHELKESLSPLIVLFSFRLIWDIPFSPFGGAARLYVPFYIILLIFVWDRLRATALENKSA